MSKRENTPGAKKRRPSTVTELRARRVMAPRLLKEPDAGSSEPATCLYALKDGEWGCHAIKPSASATIATAEAWLDKRDWEDWG